MKLVSACYVYSILLVGYVVTIISCLV